MARAGMEQAEVVQSNIVSLIANKEVKLKEYVPQFLEGSLKLSLGKVRGRSFQLHEFYANKWDL